MVDGTGLLRNTKLPRLREALAEVAPSMNPVSGSTEILDRRLNLRKPNSDQANVETKGNIQLTELLDASPPAEIPVATAALGSTEVMPPPFTALIDDIFPPGMVELLLFTLLLLNPIIDLLVERAAGVRISRESDGIPIT